MSEASPRPRPARRRAPASKAPSGPGGPAAEAAPGRPPTIDLARYIDVTAFQPLLEGLCRSSGVSAALIGVDGVALLRSNERRICVDFHQAVPATKRLCVACDARLAERTRAGEKFALCRCGNGLTSCASPVLVGEAHAANLFVGQFLDRPPGRESFRRRARRYGFDERAYLAALDEVPVISPESLRHAMGAVAGLAGIVGELGTRTAREREQADRLRESESLWRSLVENDPDFVMVVDREGKIPFCNRGPHGTGQVPADGSEALSWAAPEHRDAIRTAATEAFATGEARGLDFESVAPDGRRLWYQGRFVPFARPGRADAVLIVARDISDLRFNRLRLEAMVDEKTISLEKARLEAVRMREDAERERRRAEEALVELGRIRAGLEDEVRSRTLTLEEEVRKRRRTEEDLRESEEKFAAAFRASPTALLITVPEDGRVLDVNDGLLRMFGYSREEFLAGNAVQIWADPRDRRAVIDRIASGESVSNLETRFRRRDGDVFWGQTSAALVAIRGVPRVIANITDVADRRAAAEALRDSEERFRILFEFAPDGYLIHDERGVFVDANRKAEELTGYARGEMAGRSFFELGLFPPEHVAQVRALLKKNALGQATGPDELTLLRKDGTPAVIELLTLPITLGRQSLVLGMARDATGRRRIEDELRRHREDLEDLVSRRTQDLENSRKAAISLMQDANIQRSRAEKALEALAKSEAALIEARDMAEAASRAKSDFLANMSHELRTPLNAILGFSEILQDRTFGPLNEKQSRYVHNILSSGHHLLSVINDILDLSKVEAGKMELELGPVAVPSLLEKGLVLVREKALKHRIELALELPPEMAGFTLEADERKLMQVYFNLLSNAVKFTPDGGRIEVTAWTADSELRVRVSDSGVGIRPEDRDRIFKEFEQADASRARRHKGTGLGLAVSRKLIDLHGGRIWAESDGEGRGSRFTFAVPLRGRTGGGAHAA